MRGAETHNCPHEQRSGEWSVCYTTLSQRWRAVCTVTADCWHTQRTGGINTFVMTIYIRVCVRVCLSQPVHVGSDWPNKNNNFIMTERPPGIPRIETFASRGGGDGEKKDQTRERKWVVCVSQCVRVRACVCSSLQNSTFWFLPPYFTLAECFCESDSAPQALSCFYSPGGLI